MVLILKITKCSSVPRNSNYFHRPDFHQTQQLLLLSCNAFDDDDDDDDDEVCRVCKTPGDPCGCTRQHYQRSGLPLPCPWINQSIAYDGISRHAVAVMHSGQ